MILRILISVAFVWGYVAPTLCRADCAHAAGCMRSLESAHVSCHGSARMQDGFSLKIHGQARGCTCQVRGSLGSNEGSRTSAEGLTLFESPRMQPLDRGPVVLARGHAAPLRSSISPYRCENPPLRA